MKNRIISLLLTVALLFCLVSCKKSGEELPPKDKNLTVETETVEYTEEEINSAAEEIVDLYARIAMLLGYSIMASDEKKAEVSEVFKTDIMPVILDISLHKDELSQLTGYMRECITAAESENNYENKTGLIPDIYTKFSSVLGTERLGALVYELQLLWINHCLDRAVERYDKYGYSFYLEDIEYYTALLDEARAIGRSTFSDVLSMLVALTSLCFGSVDVDNGIMQITVADMLALMKMQGERFAKLSITQKEWQTVVKMCEEFVPSNEGGSLAGKLLITLTEENFFSQTAAIMPSIVAFYALMTSCVTDENIEMIDNGEPYAIERAVCAGIVENLDAFCALLDEIELNVPTVSDSCINAVNAYDEEGYASFLEDYSSAGNELVFAIEAFNELPTEENRLSLWECVLGYLSSVNSVVTYVYFYL